MVSEGLMKYFRRVAGFPKSRLKEYTKKSPLSSRKRGIRQRERKKAKRLRQVMSALIKKSSCAVLERESLSSLT